MMRRTVISAPILALLASTVASADEGGVSGKAAVAESDRQLAGHIFPLSSVVQNPFSTTAFGMNILLGTATASARRFDSAGNVIGTRSYDLGAFGAGFDFSARITPAFSARAHVLASAYTGTDGPSILVAGAEAQFAGGAGFTLAQNFTKQVRLGLVLDVNWQPSYSVLIANAILSSIQSGRIDTTDLFRQGKRVTTLPGVSVAYSPHPAVGIQAVATFLISKRVSGETVDKTQTGTNLGVTADFDFNKISWVPLDLSLVWHYQGINGVPVIRDYGGGLWYTRRVHLQLGLELLWRENTLRPDVQRLEAKAQVANLLLRYYW